MSSALQILQHSLGVDQYGRGQQYRNHFATSEGSTDWPVCNALVEQGLMDVQRSHPLSRDLDCFWVTVQGKAFVAANSPQPPVLTRGQKRYREFLDTDGVFESFEDFLKYRYGRRPIL
jgi:hypothetical protein